jgi:signal peptidase II
MSTKLTIVAGLAPLLLVLDQVSKVWVVRNLRYSGPRLPGPSMEKMMQGLADQGYDASNTAEIPLIDGFLSLIHTQNPGAAMGMLVDFEHRMYVFAVFTVVALAVLWSMYKALPDDDRFQSVIVALITAGALGNAIDRIHKQTVTDFVKVYTEQPTLKAWCIETFGTNEYPTWNIADSCIVVGVILYLVYYLFIERDKELAPGEAGEAPSLDDVAPPPST